MEGTFHPKEKITDLLSEKSEFDTSNLQLTFFCASFCSSSLQNLFLSILQTGSECVASRY